MPRKIRELVADLLANGFAEIAGGGKGSHRKFVHERYRGALTLSGQSGDDAKPDLPPLNVATFRERISGGANQGRARDATREEVHCGADHREAPRG